MSSWAGRQVCVAGLGVSGTAAARVLVGLGASVIAVDALAVPERDAELADLGVDVRTASPPEQLPDAELVVTSPGWRPDNPFLVAAQASGIEVIGEPELAARVQRQQWPVRTGPRWLGVTGTNGKTTTTGMLASILQAAGIRSTAAGNIGTPLIEAVMGEYDVLAVEVSSFQLHWSSSLQFDAAAILNIADDHVDWHGSMDAYMAAKHRIWDEGACAVWNADDPLTAKLAEGLHDSHPFSLHDQRAQIRVSDGWICGGVGPVAGAVDGRLAPTSAVSLPGPHNLSNALAAAALATSLNLHEEFAVTAAQIEQGLRDYRPGPHRNAVVGTVDGVRYVDDSKATNPHAAEASLSAYSSVVWIAGGLLKGADIAPLVAAQAGRLRGAVLIGRDKSVIADALARHAPDVPVVVVEAADTGAMDTAVRAAAELASVGDVVLLAPAAASMDMFRDYADRGRAFAAAVHALGPVR
ncbi:MAG: UDP-N-acetylmuramoylalanine--D-glutamate ligase [Frankiaceae bacterium]|nr:UDP-N-acetylmuramoylalanine--D-glutamate ligase [Frankiaceae bacterium]